MAKYGFAKKKKLIDSIWKNQEKKKKIIEKFKLFNDNGYWLDVGFILVSIEFNSRKNQCNK
jgi:DNA polymerase IIIc chi subunit